jgi:uncharacterized integral membrane protein
MRFIKPIIALIILALVALFFLQNTDAFAKMQEFKLNLFFGTPLTWEHSIFSLLAMSAVVGFVVGILVMLKPYLGARKRLAENRQEPQSK